MLWLVGLMGVIAVGTVTFVSPLADEAEEDTSSSADGNSSNSLTDGAPATDLATGQGNVANRQSADHVANLPPLDQSAADQVTVAKSRDTDEIMLGNQLFESDPDHIMDYAVAEDSIVLIWDDSTENSVEPRIHVAEDPETAGQTLVKMNGATVATVNGTDLRPTDIALIPLSTAIQFRIPTAI